MPSLMKGHVWHERKDAKDRKGNPIVTYPVYVEDKHDEIRCHVIVTPDCSDPAMRVLYMSYAGKPLANMYRFDEVFLTLSRGTGYTEFDLGFEVNGNFNDSYRWVRSTKGVPADLKDATFKFYVFGLPAAGNTVQRQLQWRHDVTAYAKDWVSVPFYVPFCCTVYDAGGVEVAFTSARNRGLEGVMVKQPNHLYERKRTDGWLKMKPEADADGVIIAINQAFAEDGTPHDRAGSVTLRMEDGSTASPSGLKHDLAADMWHHPEKYIGRWCEMKFMERDRQGGYRHPVWHRFREDK